MLEFPVVIEPEMIGDQLTDSLPLVVLHHGEELTDGYHSSGIAVVNRAASVSARSDIPAVAPASRP